MKNCHFHPLAVSSNNTKVPSRIPGVRIYNIMETPFLTKGSSETCYSIQKVFSKQQSCTENLQASLRRKYMS